MTPREQAAHDAWASAGEEREERGERPEDERAEDEAAERDRRFPVVGSVHNKAVVDRFIAKVAIVDDETSCWKWIGAFTRHGYGNIRISKRTRLSHRIAWEIGNGSAVPSGLEVLHECDNPPCVRPSHLTVGTHAQNMADMRARGRSPRSEGEKAGRALLSESNVIEILGALSDPTVSQSDLARRFGVSPGAIGHIATGRSWSHIPRTFPPAVRAKSGRKLPGRPDVRDAVIADPQASNRSIAKAIGTSRRTVLKWKRRLAAVAQGASL